MLLGILKVCQLDRLGRGFSFLSATLTENSAASFPLLACLSEALRATTQPLRSAYAVIHFKSHPRLLPFTRND
jgi:hypothetical protein